MFRDSAGKLFIFLVLSFFTFGVSSSFSDERADPAARLHTQLFFPDRTIDSNRTHQFVAITTEAKAHFLGNRVMFQTHDLVFQVEFLDADARGDFQGEDPQVTRVNYLIGDQPQEWFTGLPTYGKLVYHGIYPGIDVRFGFSGTRLKSEFAVSPGADPRRIRFQYTGLGQPHIDNRGDLTFTSSQGEFREESPTAFQWKGNSRVDVPARFALSRDGVVRFELGAFDASLPLIIDPVVAYSSFVGQDGDSAATAIAADANGYVYVTGWTDSWDFPIANALQGHRAGGVDAFVFKLNPSGDTLLCATYIGGSGDDRAYGIAIDGAGEAFVTGFTTSTNFPISSPIQSSLRGAKNAFVLKLSAAGNSLIFSTYLGGSGSDSSNAIALDSPGNAYIAGDTTSSDFPTRAPLQALKGGKQDAFVAMISSSGTLVYSTYLGGSEDEHATAISVDASGSAYVTGGTFSTNFPTMNALQAVNHGGQDAFVSKLNPSGGSLLYSTYLGGTGGALGSPELASGIAVDLEGNAFIAGSTSSSDFPTSAAYQSGPGGGTIAAFITKLNSTGSALVYSTYVGGGNLDYANAIAVDSAGNAYVAGYAGSPNLPLASPVQGALAGGYDAFVLRLNQAGSGLDFATFYGGSGLDAANGIALDSSGVVYVAGQTLSADFPVVGGIQTSKRGPIQGFVLKLILQPDFSLSVTPASQKAIAGDSAVYILTATAANGFSGVVNFGVSGLPPGATASFNPPSVTGSGSSILTVSTAATGGIGNFTVAMTGMSGAMSHANSAMLNVTPPISVTPNAGSGSSQSFSFSFSDAVSAANIISASIDIGAMLSQSGSCYVYFARASNLLFLADDGGVFRAASAVGSATAASNSQCTLNAGASSVTLSGTTLTLNLALSFKPAFAGAKNIYVDVFNWLDSGWALRGTWTVTASALPDFSLSITPGTQSVVQGSSTSYTVTVASLNGFSGVVSLGVSGLPPGATGSFLPTTVTGAGSTTVTVNTLASGGAGNFTVMVTGGSGGLNHSVSALLSLTVRSPPSAVSVTPNSGSGTAQTFAFAFSDPAGAASIVSATIQIGAMLSQSGSCYVYFARASNLVFLADDAGMFHAGLTAGSTGTAANSQCILNAGASSAVLSGNTLTLNLALSFKAAFAGVKYVYMEVYNGLDSGWAQRGTWTSTTSVQPDFAMSLTPGSQSVVKGGTTSYTVSVAALSGFSGVLSFGAAGLPSGATASFAPATLTGSGSTTLTVNTSSAGGTGNFCVIVTATSSGLNHSASAPLTVTNSSPPAAVSVTPNGGSGSPQTFVFTFSDVAGAANIISATIDIGPVLSQSGSCYAYFAQVSNLVYLADDAGMFHSALPVGVAGGASNSQCVLDAGASSAIRSGNTLTLNLALSFKTAFAGAKKIFMEVFNGQDSGWVQRGTWTSQ